MNNKLFIIPEIQNKLLVRLYKIEKQKYNQVIFFQYQEVSMIKNLIQLELLFYQRPKISAQWYNKKIYVRLQNQGMINQFLQKRPIPWNKSFDSIIDCKESFFGGVFVVKNNKNTLLTINKRSKLDLLIKTAYLD